MDLIMSDAVALSGVRTTKDGYLVADARIARTGIQIYAGYEVGKPDMAQVRVWRPEAEVFSADAMASMAARPVTIEHPDEPVTADNWKRHAVGFTGEGVARDGGYIRVPLTLMDKAAIDAVKAGKRELSVGYSCQLEFTAGTTPDGEAYDAVQRGIRGNHLAVVDAGRAGPLCRIGDNHHRKDRKVTDKALRTITVDGLPIEVSDQAAAVIAKIENQLADARKALETKTGEVAAINAAHAKTIEAKDGEIAALKAQIPDAAALDALASARAEIIAQAKAILGDSYAAKGRSEADIRRDCVAKVLGDAAKGMGDEAIKGAFGVVAVSKADPVRDALRTTVHVTGDGDAQRKAAYAKRIADMQSAWKGEAR